MSNIIDEDGITVNTFDETVTDIATSFKAAYGDEINIDSDTPDGQAINIFAQAVTDLLDLIVQIYNSFDPDNALGTVLDQRCAINGVQRLGGTFTIQPVVVTTDRAVSLPGLGAAILDTDGTGFTISDDEDNEFILTETTYIATAGTTLLSFRAKNNGAVLTLPDTLTTIKTVTLGVTEVNNPGTYTTLGLDEESDYNLRLRRSQSVSLASQGYLSGLLASLLNISGVTYAKVYENNLGATDVDGIPPHSIWTIVEGGDSSDIAWAIYTKRNAGCGMKGDITVDVTQPDLSMFEIKFDRTEIEDLYVNFDATSIDGITTIGTTFIATELASDVNLDVNESINVNDIAALVRDIDSNALITNIAVSTDGSDYFPIVEPSAKNKRLTLLYSNVDITVT